MIDEQQRPSSDESLSWGPALFYATLGAALVFFWWVLIYGHGAAGNGG